MTSSSGARPKSSKSTRSSYAVNLNSFRSCATVIGGFVQGEGILVSVSNKSQETAAGVIELKEDNSRAVEAMLRFMYTFDYDSSGSDWERASPILFNVEVYSIAEKYGVLPLKLQAKEKFEKAIQNCWDMDDFSPAITEIYNSTPTTDRGLRDAVVEISHEHICRLLEKHAFRDVLEETAGFAADVTQQMASSDTAMENYRCPNCGKCWKAVVPASGTYYCIQCGYRQSNWEKYKT